MTCPDAHSESVLGLPTPALTCVRMCICGITFLTGASNNHNDSFPFVLSFASFCALHHFWRAWFAALLPPLVFPFPPARFPLDSPCSSCPGG